MKRKHKPNPYVGIAALLMSFAFRNDGFTQEQIEFYFELNKNFLKSVKVKRITVRKLLRYYADLKKAVIKLY